MRTAEAAPKSALTVTIVGATTAERNVSCEYTAEVSGGTPPYDFSWIGSGLVAGWSDQTAPYRWSSIGNKLIWVDVSDQLNDTGSAGLGLTVLSTGS